MDYYARSRSFNPIYYARFRQMLYHKAPKEINYIFGYRTTMSMKNKDTWQFAHSLIGKIWFYMGIVLLPLVIILMLLLLGKDKDTIGNLGTIICIFEIIPLVVSIIPVEIALRKNFYIDGNKEKLRSELND